MAKGSLFWGKGRGKLGEAVLSVTKGQQVSRAYNAEPANPKTDKQMLQRARLANAVKFYKMMTRGLFKFAYEDKKALESDYNAFMRHNLAKSPLLLRNYSQNVLYPGVGSLMVSQGRLDPVALTYDAQDHFYNLPAKIGTWPDEYTDGDFFKAIMGQYTSLQNGDIMTIVMVRSAASISHDPNVDYPVKVNIRQFVVNSEATTGVLPFETPSGVGVTSLQLEDANSGAYAGGCAIIFSRVVEGEPLIVSTSYYCENRESNDLWSTFNEEDILNSWGARGRAILEGGRLRNS